MRKVLGQRWHTCGCQAQEKAQAQAPFVKVAVRRNSLTHRTNIGDVKRK